MNHSNVASAVALGSLLLLSACGGGGGGNSNPPPPVDTTAPETTLSGGPAAQTSSRSASFTLASTETGGTFQAQLDGGAYQTVTSPHNLTALVDGNHTLNVRAVDAAGNVDASPATFTWQVDGTAPTAQILFPTGASYTDASSLQVRGTALDARVIASLTVNGVAATSTDAFRTWSAVVPIVAGNNTIAVAATDALGNTNAAAATASVANRGTSIALISAIELDAANDRLLVGDAYARSVLAVNRTTGHVQVLSSDQRGTGPTFMAGEHFALDAANNRLFVHDSVTQELIAVDLTSGNRTLISAGSVQPAISSGIAWDAPRNRILGSMLGGDLYAIDATTGARTLFSGMANSGPDLDFVSDVLIDDAGATPRLIVAASNRQTIYTVDLTTGDRALLSHANTRGTGPTLTALSNLAIDAAGNRLLVTSLFGSAADRLLAVDLTSGDRTQLVANTAINSPTGIAFDAATSRLFVASQVRSRVQVVNTSTLAISTLSDNAVGTGEISWDRNGLTLDRSGASPVLYTVNGPGNTYVRRTDLATGNRTAVSSTTVGTGANFFYPQAFALDTRPGAPARQALVLDVLGNGALQTGSVNLDTGNRTSLAPVNTFTSVTALGPLDPTRGFLIAVNGFTTQGIIQWVNPVTGVATNLVDPPAAFGGSNVFGLGIERPAGGTARGIGYSSGSIFDIDLTNGSQTVLSGGATGSGPALLSAALFDVDSGSRRALLVSNANHAVQSVDLVTGARTILSGTNPATQNEVGAGPRLDGQEYSGSVAYDATANLLYFKNGDRLFAIDLVSGDRVIASR